MVLLGWAKIKIWQNGDTTFSLHDLDNITRQKRHVSLPSLKPNERYLRLFGLIQKKVEFVSKILLIQIYSIEEDLSLFKNQEMAIFLSSTKLRAIFPSSI